MTPVHRRDFLRWMAASPLFATLACSAEGSDAGSGPGAAGAGPSPGGAPPGAAMITRPADALDVFDLERVAAQKIPRKSAPIVSG